MSENRYFLRTGDATPWHEVTRAEFIKAERAAGFHPKGGGDDTLATGGFGAYGVRGTIVSRLAKREHYDFDPDLQALVWPDDAELKNKIESLIIPIMDGYYADALDHVVADIIEAVRKHDKT